MNKFFESAILRYDKMKGREFLINPISSFDAEIIVELGQILKKAGLTDVLAILGSYKENKDEETRDELLQWNIDHPNLGMKRLVNKVTDKIHDDIEKEEKRLPVYYEIGDITIFEYDLRGFMKFDRFDEKKEDYVYGIILNPMPEGHKMTQVPIFADYKIEYSDEKNRNKVLENLSAYLRDKDIDIIDLERDE